jgi:hypothetical protein
MATLTPLTGDFRAASASRVARSPAVSTNAIHAPVTVNLSALIEAFGQFHVGGLTRLRRDCRSLRSGSPAKASQSPEAPQKTTSPAARETYAPARNQP